MSTLLEQIESFIEKTVFAELDGSDDEQIGTWSRDECYRDMALKHIVCFESKC